MPPDPPGPAPSNETPGRLASIIGRRPSVYLPLTTAEATDASGNGAHGTFVGGTPAVRDGAVDLGGTIYLEIPHQAAWQAKRSQLAWVGIEGAISCFATIKTLTDYAYVMSKSGKGLGPLEVSLYAMADGSVVLRFSTWDGMRREIRTVAGVVRQGVRHHLSMHMDRSGAWATVDGRTLYDGYPHPAGWRGFDTRVAADYYRNSQPIQIGRDPVSGSPTDMTVSHVAAWFREPVESRTGRSRSLRSHPETLVLHHIQEIAGTSGPAIADHKWGARPPVTVSAGIQAAVDAQSAAGGGTVFVRAGTIAETFVPKSNVRVVGLGDGVVLTGGESNGDGLGTEATLIDPGGGFSPGAESMPIGTQVEVGDLVHIYSRYKVQARWMGSAAYDNDAFNRFHHTARVRFVGGPTAYFDRPHATLPDCFKDPQAGAAYPEHQDERRDAVVRVRNQVGHASIENITFRGAGDPVVRWRHISDLRLVRLGVHQTSLSPGADGRVAMRLWDTYDVHGIACRIENDCPDNPAGGNLTSYGLMHHKAACWTVFLDSHFRANGWHSVAVSAHGCYLEHCGNDHDGGSGPSGTYCAFVIDSHAGGAFVFYGHSEVEMGSTVSGYKVAVENIQFTTKNDGTEMTINDGTGGGFYRDVHYEAPVRSLCQSGFSGRGRPWQEATFVRLTHDGPAPQASKYWFHADGGRNRMLGCTGQADRGEIT